MEGQLAILNPRPARIPGPKLLHHLVASDVPDSRAAIEYLSPDGIVESLTYGELHKRADVLARSLRSSFERTSPSNQSRFIVPVFIPQCPDLYITQLAVLKAGAAFCPISLDVPEERLRFILQDVDGKLLLTTSTQRERLPNLEDAATVISVDENCSDDSLDAPSVEVDASQPAYIMYTSGSTGLPKGVVLSHSAATQALLAHDRHIPHFSRFLQFASPTFDVSVFEIFFPLFRRATLVCGDRRQLLTDLPGFVNHMQIDAAELTPSVASSLLNGRKSVPTLKLLLTIGEMLKRDVVEDFGGSGEEDAILYGMYGPTEATIHCTLQPIFSKSMSVRNIGVPLETVSAFVVKPQSDDASEEVEVLKVDEEGELAVGGYQLADEYLNRPEQTTAAFVHHSRYGRLYRTGDRAKLTHSGSLECFGRISAGQVKLRGQRIELGEVEYAALKTPGCRTVVADVIDRSLVVFCVCDPETSDQRDVQEHCRRWLPAFMVPGDVLLLEDLPHLDSGKINLKALHELYSNNQRTKQKPEESLTSRQKTIVQVVSEVLHTQVGLHTQLSAAGLDSITSIRLASRLKQAGLPQPNAASLLELRHVGDIESELDSQEDAGDSHESDAELSATLRNALSGKLALSKEIEDVFAPTPMQSAMLAETLKDDQAYCNWIELEIATHLTDKQIEAQLYDLAQQHGLLRSGFSSVEGLQVAHAVVVWNRLHASQIRQVHHFQYDFKVSGDVDLLHPCSFQILHSDHGIRILVQIHHALYDQWSMDVLRADLGSLVKGQAISPRPSFASVSAHHISHSEEIRSEAQLEFWQNYLRDFSPSTLPLMGSKRRSPNLQRTCWQGLGVDLPSLRSAVHDLGCTAPTFFQAAMTYLIGCYTGTTDVTYGVVYSGRHISVPDIERIFGPCLNTLPLRTDYSTTRTFSDLLRLTHDRNRSVQMHSLTPLSDIKGSVNLKGGSPLFDALFVWQETSLVSPEADPLVREVDSADHHEFNLVLEFEPSHNGVNARATYQQALISAEQVDILLRQIGFLVNNLISNPDTLIEQLSSCFPDDILSVSNPSPSFASRGRSLVSQIEAQAERAPSAPALVFAEKPGVHPHVLTYQDLNSRANKLANFLTSLSALPSEVICICMEKSTDLYVAILASIKTGSGYLPLVPETPPSRIQSILRQSNVKLCLCDGRSAPTFTKFQDVQVVDVPQTDLKSFSPISPQISSSGSEIAYTVFTSGSTGEPKGVAVTMGNLLGNLQVLAELYKTRPGDRLLQACSQAFDVSVFEIFFAFYTGMCLCSAPKDVLFGDLEGSIRTLNISHLSLTPTVAALIDPDNVPTVRFLVTAGEAVTDLVHRRWAGRGLHQGYGPSETTNICTINMDVLPDDALGNIGRPFRNTSAFVISPSDNFELLPAGAVGEFAFGGEQVFQGYVGRADLNAEKIIDHPRYGRVYRSGDVGRILSDGSLLISGRLDDQVKVRGNRIELGEINAVLLRDPAVHDCTTIVLGQDASEQILASFIVLDSQHEKNGMADLAKFDNDTIFGIFNTLEQSLPQYMIPNVVVPITRLPLTFQSKLDRRALRGLLENLDDETRNKLNQHQDIQGNDEPWSFRESKIAEVLADLLQISSASVTRNISFFALGLNSIRAISFARLLSAQLNTAISVSTVLNNPSCAKLSRVVDDISVPTTANGHLERRELLPRNVVEAVLEDSKSHGNNIESVLPCTPLQEAMLSASASSRSSYCNSTVLQVHGKLSRLQECWTEMLSRHQILRTFFVATENSAHPYVQVVLAKMALPWHQYDKRSMNTANGDSNLVDASKPFRIDAYTNGDNAKLVLHMHHSIYDGISMSLLFGEVESMYHDRLLQSPPSIEPFLEDMKSHNSKQAMAFWSTQLKNFEPTPFKRQSSERQALEASVEVAVPILSSELDALCRRYSISQLAIFQTALLKTLACSLGVRDICFGNVVSGRSVSVPDIDRLVAPCFNTIPVRVDFSSMTNNLQLACRLNQQNIDALSYQLTPLRRIQRLSRSPSKHLFDTLLLLQPPNVPLDGNIWELEDDEGPMDLPLVLEITPRDDNFVLVLHYQRTSLQDNAAECISEAFISAVQSILKFPSSDIGHFDQFEKSHIASCLADPVVATGDDHQDPSLADDDWSEEEAKIRYVFANLAGVSEDSISRQTSMYQIGLDSLNAAQVAAKLRSSSIQVDAADVMESLTPFALAGLVRQEAGKPVSQNDAVDLEAFDHAKRPLILDVLQTDDEDLEAVRPCTSIQAGMISQSLQSEGELYINHVSYRVPQATSREDIHRAWRAVVAQHQVLRMGFHQMSDSRTPFSMSILRPSAASVPIVDSEDDVQLDAIHRAATLDIMKSIRRHPWRVTLHRTKEDDVMVLSLHHALYDASSLGLLLSDFSRALSFSNLKPRSSIDSVLRSTLNAAADSDKSTADFWSSALESINVSKFPDLTPTSTVERSQQTANYTCDLSLAFVEDFCRQTGSTIQAVGQTAWALLLAAYTGDAAVTFGTIMSGSPAVTQDVAFPSITTILVPCSTDRDVNDIVQKMVDYNASIHRHRFASLADIQRFAGHPGEQIFDTVFVYQKTHSDNVFDWPVINETAAVDYTASLELEIDESGKFHLRLTFDTSRIPKDQASMILRQYEHILMKIVSQDLKDDEKLYSILPASEPTLPSRSPFLHGLFEDSVRQNPDSVALEFVWSLSNKKISSKKWTYKELDDRGNQVAQLLQKSEVRPNGIVAVCMSKCPEASFAFIGILKMGCAFLAIDPELPQSRVDFILEDSGAQMLLVDEAGSSRATSETVPCSHLDERSLSKLPTSPIVIDELRPDSTCYCLYTSGTTGTPKGCELTHDNAVQAMMAFQRLFAGRWTGDSRWLQFASYWFDVSVLEQFWSWGVGITVVGAPRDLVLEDISEFIRNLNITHIDLTPSLARIVHPEDVLSLWNGVFITGGEALKQEIIESWGPKKTICNGYGPTEATIGVTMNPFIGADAKASNIGRQFDNVGSFVLKPDSDEPVLRGAVGELCVSGRLVGKGYLNRPELTSKSFPFLARFGEKVYRTGDLVRILSDGSFIFMGRKDTQAKLRGQRLEISEIDHAIQHCDEGIAHVVSQVTKANDDSRETLISFLTINTHGKDSQLAIDQSEGCRRLVKAAKEACANQLPGYMVPTHILPINFLPLTVNNKVDGKRLTELYLSSSFQDLQSLQADDEDHRSLDPTEQQICEALAEMLPIREEDVSPRSNLFSLGLSSVSAILFSSLLKRSGFKNANVATVMSNPTLHQLRAALTGNSSASKFDRSSIDQARLSMNAFSQRYLSTAAQKLQVVVDKMETVAPCTPLQQGLILDSLRDPSQPYFNEFRYELKVIDVGRLKTAIQRLVDSAQVLRTRFIDTEEGFAQAVLKQRNAPIAESSSNIENISSLMTKKKEQWLEENELEVVSPFEIQIVHSSPRSFMVVHIHHALYDGISYELLMDHLAGLYITGSAVDFGPSFTDALPYGPLRSIKNGRQFWEKRLAGSRGRSLTVKNNGDDQTNSSVSFQLKEGTRLEEARKALGVSHQAVVQACFEVAIRQNIPAVQTYGVVVSGRSIELDGADKILGPMFNTLPHPLFIRSESTMPEHVRRCHNMNIDSLSFQHTPLRDIRKWCPSSSLFDVLFVFQSNSTSEGSAQNGLWKLRDGKPRAEYPLACEVELEANGSMTVTLLAQNRHFEEQDLHALLDGFKAALNHVSNDASLGDLFGIESTPEMSETLQQTDHTPHMNGFATFEWTPQAKALRDTIANVVGMDAAHIGAHTTIFALGLDSIDAVKLASRLKKTGMLIPVSKILQAQTIPKMLQMIESTQKASKHSDSESTLSAAEKQLESILPSGLHDTNVERILPATPHQEGLLAEMLRSELREYFNHDVMKLRPDVDLDRLKSAWQVVVNTHPILRTSFVEVEDPESSAAFAQVVRRFFEVQFNQVEAKNIDDLDQVFDGIRQDASANIEKMPPLRLTTITTCSDRYIILSLAHALYDGYSLALLHEDVKRAYKGACPPRPSYDEVIEAALDATNQDAQEFWAGALSGATLHSFPRRNSDVTTKTHRADVESDLNASTIRSFCQTHGISLQALAQTCWALTLAQYTGSLEVLFGVVLACRDTEQAQEIMFPTMNTTVVRSSLHGSRVQMLQYMQSVITDTLPYQRTPLRMIQAAGAARVMRQGDSQLGNGLFDTLFIYQHRPSSTESQDAPLYDSVSAYSDVEYPVAVEMEAVSDKLFIRAACKDTVLDGEQTTQLVTTVNRVLQGIVEAPNDPTVEFEGRSVSVCGLESFQLNDVENDDEASDEEPEASAEVPSPLSNEITEALAQVSKVPVSQLTANSTIENIGIDSISAIKVAALLRKKSVDLPVSEILRAKTPKKMAKMVESKTNEKQDPPVSSSAIIEQACEKYTRQDIPSRAGVDPSNVETVMPATAGQVYMLSMWQKTGGQIFYPMFSYRAEGNISFERIHLAWKELVARHSILRTVFCATGDIEVPVVQVVLREPPNSYERDLHYVVRLSGLQPIVSLNVWKQRVNRYVLELSIHHALYDAISLPLLMQDLQSSLAKTPLAAQRLSHADFIAQSATPQAREDRKRFWTQYLQNIKSRQRLSQPQNDGPQKKVEIFKPSIFSKIRDLETIARKEGLALQAVIFAAYAKLYSSLCTAQGDVVLGMYLSNRSHLADLDTLTAPTLNLAPLLVRSPHEKTLLDLSREVHTDLQEIGTAVNSAVGLWEIEEWSGVKVDTFINFLKLPDSDDENANDGVTIRALDDERLQERSQVIEASETQLNTTPGLKGLNSKVLEAYQHSLDIEMTVTNGNLDIGLFCPEAMLGLEAAEGALEEMKQMLGEFVGKAEK